MKLVVERRKTLPSARDLCQQNRNPSRKAGQTEPLTVGFESNATRGDTRQCHLDLKHLEELAPAADRAPTSSTDWIRLSELPLAANGGRGSIFLGVWKFPLTLGSKADRLFVAERASKNQHRQKVGLEAATL